MKPQNQQRHNATNTAASCSALGSSNQSQHPSTPTTAPPLSLLPPTPRPHRRLAWGVASGVPCVQRPGAVWLVKTVTEGGNLLLMAATSASDSGKTLIWHLCAENEEDQQNWKSLSFLKPDPAQTGHQFDIIQVVQRKFDGWSVFTSEQNHRSNHFTVQPVLEPQSTSVVKTPNKTKS